MSIIYRWRKEIEFISVGNLNRKRESNRWEKKLRGVNEGMWEVDEGVKGRGGWEGERRGVDKRIYSPWQSEPWHGSISVYWVSTGQGPLFSILLLILLPTPQATEHLLQSPHGDSCNTITLAKSAKSNKSTKHIPTAYRVMFSHSSLEMLISSAL